MYKKRALKECMRLKNSETTVRRGKNSEKWKLHFPHPRAAIFACKCGSSGGIYRNLEGDDERMQTICEHARENCFLRQKMTLHYRGGAV